MLGKYLVIFRAYAPGRSCLIGSKRPFLPMKGETSYCVIWPTDRGGNWFAAIGNDQFERVDKFKEPPG